MIFSPKPNSPKSYELGLIAPDKSLSHRSIIFSFLTQGKSQIKNFLYSQDTLATKRIAELLGANIEEHEGELLVSPPCKIPQKASLQCLNSGTSIRLYAGLLSAREGIFHFDGDESLRKRPMQRIKTPLEEMGAEFSSALAPFDLKGSSLKGITFQSPIASAQVKSAFILAALQAKNPSLYSESILSRDHTERFLSFLGADILSSEQGISITPLSSALPPYEVKIPNDPSSLMFFVIACLIAPQMQLKISEVLLNPTRIYALEVLKQMGAKIGYVIQQRGMEEIGEIEVYSSELKGIEISSKIAWLIDEIPVLSIAFACAKGRSKITHAKELRVKESDRIHSVVYNLAQLGIEAIEFEDGFEVLGGEFQKGKILSYGDHRIAMSFALAGIRTEVEIDDVECINVSFPKFFEFFEYFAQIKE